MMYLFPDHDIVFVVAVVGIPQFTCGDNRTQLKPSVQNKALKTN